MPPLTNWYAPEVSCLQLHVTRIACQRSNCWWNAKQRRRCAIVVLICIIGIFAAVLVLAMGQRFTSEDFVLKVAAPLSPALLLGIRQFIEHREAANRLDKLREHSEQVWKDALKGTAEAEITTRSRGLQDEIFEHRKRNPPVCDALFKKLRDKLEAQMNRGIAGLVKEAKDKMRLP